MATKNVTDTTNGSDSVSDATTLPTTPVEHRQEDTVTPLKHNVDVDGDGHGDKLVCKFIKSRFVNTLTKVSESTTKSLCDGKTKVCVSAANVGSDSVKQPGDNDVDGNNNNNNNDLL